MPKLINYPHLASMVFGQPHYATPLILGSIKSVLVPRLAEGLGVSLAAGADMPEPVEPVSLEARGESRYQVAGLAIIPVHGILTARRGQIDASCTELTSYEWLRGQLATALADDRVKEIVLDINSGGGMAVGCKDLADYIHANRGVKPITALVNFCAYSAAYFLAAACSRVVIGQTGGVGSIGVIMEHMEVSKWEESVGIKFTTFYRGERKKDGSPHEPLSDGALEAINGMMDKAYGLFTESIATYRKLPIEAVIATQAGLYTGRDAIDAGLADEMANPQDFINALAGKYAKPDRASQRIGLRAAAMNQTCLL